MRADWTTKTKQALESRVLVSGFCSRRTISIIRTFDTTKENFNLRWPGGQCQFSHKAATNFPNPQETLITLLG